MALKIFAIAAMDEGRVIGVSGRIPWHIKEDMQRFSALTGGHTVLMGRKTFDSLPLKYKPLPNRKNVVVSRSISAMPEFSQVELCDDAQKCLEQYRSGEGRMQGSILWIIGGEQIYRETMPFWDELYLTVVHSKNIGDAFFPEFEKEFSSDGEAQCGTSGGVRYSFLHYIRK